MDSHFWENDKFVKTIFLTASSKPKMSKIKPYYIWLAFSLITLTVIGIVSLKLPFRGDERHIVETIKLFADNFNFNTIKDYPEVTPPFFFMFYALWAKIFGASTESLRIITLIISLITWQLVYYLFGLFTQKKYHALLLSTLVITNPYFFGTSVFVFTDMLTIMLSLAAVISFLRNKNILFIIFSTLAILCRQYAVIIPMSVILFSLLNYKNDKQISRKYVIGSLLTFLPLLVLFVIWKNISPASGIEKWIIPNSAIYNLDYINTYITFSVIYIFPLVIVFFKKIKLSYLSLFIAIAITILLSLLPVKTSMATLEFTDYKTVGFVHQALAEMFGLESIWLKIFLVFFLFVGCYMNIELLKRFYVYIRKKTSEKEMIFTILWFLFLLIMPFSYQVWEKYLTMILSLFILSIYLLLFPANLKSSK
jgi:4-amino-4-deoxy-L-arabinose transferase-like glycosyltransferase